MLITKPLVSVLMTAYNREKYIAEAIESVLASSYSNFELIIVDDCSVDRTVSISLSYEKMDNRVKVFKNEKNVGDYNNRNKAASFANGKYIKYLDSDDTIYPWGLEAMVYCMEKFPTAGFGLMSYGLMQETPFPVLVQPREAYRSFFFENFLFLMGPSGAIINRAKFEKFGGFSGEKYIGDTEFWLRVGAKFPLVRMPFDLIWWRQHEEQQIVQEINDRDIAIKRYHSYVQFLTDTRCPLNSLETSAVLRNLKNMRLRDIVFNHFLRLKLRQGLRLMKLTDITFFELFTVLRRNSYPHVHIQGEK